MPIGQVNTVWILGAGFSRSLGGPLLVDLFRPRAWGDDADYFPDSRYPDLANCLHQARLVFNQGREDGLWVDAEQFLAYVDEAFASGESPQKGVLGRLLTRTNSIGKVGNGPPAGFSNSSNKFASNWTASEKILRDSAVEPLIAAPGRSKAMTASGSLASLWACMRSAILCSLATTSAATPAQVARGVDIAGVGMGQELAGSRVQKRSNEQ